MEFLQRVNEEPIRTGIGAVSPISRHAEDRRPGEAWDNGYAKEAVELMCDHAFRERRLHKVFAHAYVTNEASCRVLEKAGFEREGTLRDERFVDGSYVDLARYGVLAPEWLE